MIECKNISKSYFAGVVETEVLKNINFKIDKGEFVSIIGPSGSGKSTLMHILGALDNPTGGQYFLDGKDVSSLSEDELAKTRQEKIGFVFQSFNLLPRATVMRNVVLPMIYAGVPKEEREEKAKQALLLAGLTESHFYHLSNQLSGGQMQRVAIARSLVNNPSIILADEPTGNLDSKTGDIVLATFQDLHAKGKTIILITHEQYVAEHTNRIITIRDGQIISDRKSEKKIINQKC
ncbi:MAG: ABC transporter ATP-binding protein [Patescibacteria group bacterium]|jgi:putative ABC transport system ATP-binding protein